MPTPSAFSRPHADCSWVSGQGPRACCCLDSWLLPICRHLRAAEPSTALKLYLIMKVNAPIRRLLWYILKHELGDWGWYGVMLTQQCDWWDVCVMRCVCVSVCICLCSLRSDQANVDNLKELCKRYLFHMDSLTPSIQCIMSHVSIIYNSISL